MKELLFSLGALSVLWGLMELLLPSERWHKLVRAALGLMLLSTLLSALPGFDMPEPDLDLSAASAAVPETGPALGYLLSASVGAKIRSDLRREDVRVEVSVKTDQTGCFFADKVILFGELTPAERETAIGILASELGVTPAQIMFCEEAEGG